MKRYGFQIQYKGTNYVGWQIQPNGLSVEEKIESALNKLFNSNEIKIIGCGRTDAGVHANDYFFHVDLEEKFNSKDLHFKLNKILPSDIVILNVLEVSANFHARFDAISRTYRYKIHQLKNPFLIDTSLLFTQNLDFEKMNLACEFLLGKQDFTSFSKLHTDVKTNLCNVMSAKWFYINESEIYFEIKADRFLRNMVRAVVGTLLEVGEGKIPPDEIKTIIEKKDRGEAKLSVPAHGLYLWEIKYNSFA